MTLEHLDKVLEDKTLEDLKAPIEVSVSNIIEPTEAEIESILEALSNGLTHKEIKATIRRDVDGASLGFTFSQIREIDDARLAKIAELTPEVDPVIEK